ncbi:gfo/Idh/MocA family oxidoreductase [Bacteroides sp. 214]|uniref:Gfo/Idh/MocA family protein n=1 Tax=Bacteroides sp. 214 TaxID=2302935 RepID=UPI0013CF8BA0|nr:Gfo/Idh/MocA family oxidoreductase [Bacteroides sp. 214]NDW12124.1 gfo/Idh/MocA family oxidoreductase [Bacteroides sp. 214]
MDRRKFLKTSGVVAGGLMAHPVFGFEANDQAPPKSKKIRYAMVGCGHRGSGMWGKTLVDTGYKEYIDFVGLCDINPGRIEYTKRVINEPNCPAFSNFDEMLKKTKPDVVMVATTDSTHDEFIIKALDAGVDVITEKPMTTDEDKCQAILDAEKRSGKKVTVTFNYRYSPHRAKLYELLRSGEIGDITSVDFHWYLDTSHGADYFRRWHGYKKYGGSLLVHKSTHHFDLLNWWIGSEPEEVFAYGALEFYGKNGKMRGKNCRLCDHKTECQFYRDITKEPRLMALYAENEKYDGYFRDGCVFREDIDIFDKMAVQIRYMNKVQVSYSLTAYSPYEGYRIAFNGTKGRIDAWIKERQPWEELEDGDVIRITKNFGKSKIIRVMPQKGGHGGGDPILHAHLFKNQDLPDTLKQGAGVREGAMSILMGVAARKSIDSGKAIKIESLTTLKPKVSTL